MPDGSNLILGRLNTSASETRLTRSGAAAIPAFRVLDSNATAIIGSSGSAPGVWGGSQTHNGAIGTSDSGNGVWDAANAGAGVFGRSRERDGVVGDGRWRGVYGVCRSADPGPNVARTSFLIQAGVYGHDPNGYGQGVVGESYGGYGVAGAGSIGVVAEAFIPESSSIGILARAARQGRAGVFIGNVQIAGNLEHRGHIRGAVEHADGSRRQLYGLQSPEGWIEDFGRAQIAQGRTWVALDADFASVIQAEHYHVFLTPEGDSAGLYVSDRGPDGFEVREQGGGTSDLAFSYRVVAKPRKLEAKRFEEVEEIQELAEPTLSTATPTPPDLPPVYEVPVLQEAEAPPS